MRILITGGWGFIGGRLAQYLQKEGHKIILASRFSRDTPEWLPESEVYCIDWESEFSLQQACQGVDVIIHSAGMNAKDCIANPIEALEVNGYGTEKLIQAAISKCVQRFVYLSTAHVYSNPLVGEISDSTFPLNNHPYATSHLVGENALLKAHENRHINGVVLRLSNTYGYPTHKEVNCWMLLVNDICKQAVENNQIIIKSSGLQYRDFISMNALCNVVSNIIQNNLITGCFNVCSENSKTVIEMAEYIQRRCNFILNIYPTITTNNCLSTELNKVLNLKMPGLKKFGIHINNDLQEIDTLLVNCRNWFSK
jgi:UDP-glucose 4-epimerase